MSRTPARFTQADVARTIRAAIQAGASAVEIRPDGSIIVAISADALPNKATKCLDVDREIEL